MNRRKARENLWQRCIYTSIYLYHQHSTAFCIICTVHYHHRHQHCPESWMIRICIRIKFRYPCKILSIIIIRNTSYLVIHTYSIRYIQSTHHVRERDIYIVIYELKIIYDLLLIPILPLYFLILLLTPLIPLSTLLLLPFTSLFLFLKRPCFYS